MNTRARMAHGTGEWAATNVNIQRGCEHDCLYCYAKQMAIRFGRATWESWGTPVLSHKQVKKGYGRRRGTIMFPSTHDITPLNIGECVTVLRKMLAAGNRLLIVSKPCVECVWHLCDELSEYKDRILFRFTIGSVDNSVLAFWEPGAPAFDERLAALKHAHSRGFETSVSCEPMLDARVDRVVKAVAPYVTDAIWLGRANRMRNILKRNCPGDAEALRRADELIAVWNDEALISLYERYRDNPLIKFKDSIKKVAGLERPTMKGLDV
jgi:DNA repair photolyase